MAASYQDLSKPGAWLTGVSRSCKAKDDLKEPKPLDCTVQVSSEVRGEFFTFSYCSKWQPPAPVTTTESLSTTASQRRTGRRE